MELHIERKRYIQGETVKAVSEPVVTVPYISGQHETPIGVIGLQIGRFNRRTGTEKIVMTSDALSTKRSETRRIVEFPKDVRKAVSQDINETEVFVFRRIKDMNGGSRDSVARVQNNFKRMDRIG